jgi:hypothetical protein
MTPLGEAYLSSPGNILDNLWNVMVLKGIFPNNINGRKVFQTLVSRISDERLYGKDGILKNMDGPKERVKSRTIETEYTLHFFKWRKQGDDQYGAWEGNYEVDINEDELAKTIQVLYV